MPTAGEEVWDDLDGQANGIATISNKGTLGYSGSFGPLGVSASYNKDDAAAGATTDGSSESVVISGSVADGVEVFYGIGSKSGTSSHNGTDLTTAGVTYTSGAVTVGAQLTDIDKSAVNSDVERTHIAVSFAVNENMSVSYGLSTVEFESASKVDQTDNGLPVLKIGSPIVRPDVSS